LESLQSTTNYAAQSVNARGTIPVVCLHDVLNHAREIALHGVRHGATVALAVAQVRSGHELRLIPYGFPATDHPEDHENLVEDFFKRREYHSLFFLGRRHCKQSVSHPLDYNMKPVNKLFMFELTFPLFVSLCMVDFLLFLP